jgi:hypothetical protein
VKDDELRAAIQVQVARTERMLAEFRDLYPAPKSKHLRLAYTLAEKAAKQCGTTSPIHDAALSTSDKLDRVWLMAMYVGQAYALAGADTALRPPNRPLTRTAQLLALYERHPDLSPATLNSMLPVPLDEREAKRVIAKRRREDD